ncbi:MAG: DUF4159 domain-containing protein [Limimaricola sp.]|uniref:DUF4159 domain-containing protein n=1 Tax=Limimaricola sp. TaxID=2211665 RepID=UPI001DA26B59|nr:DUF4159 domain-containing protein [Limimaricola sp.]MBI1417626.1 DUF4159 domain-containing protein [Limimaricola sp.]
MNLLGPLGFAAPGLLLGLVALPILWLILRAVPPAPIRRRFPGVALLLGLSDEAQQADRTPWWLMLLRMLAVAALIVGFAGPVLNPQTPRTGTGPLLILADGTWADAPDWTARADRIAALLAEAGRAGRPVALAVSTDLAPVPLDFTDAAAAAQTVANLQPHPWLPDAASIADWAAAQKGDFDTFWLSDGLARDSRDSLLAALEAHGKVSVFQTPRPVLALRPARFADGKVTVAATRTPTGLPLETPVAAIGPDPAGVERQLATATLSFAAGSATADVALDLPTELRNRVTRFELPGLRSAAAISLTDDTLKRRRVALIGASGESEALQLLSPLFYLRQALAPSADLIDGTVSDVLQAKPDVIILADVPTLAKGEDAAMLDWVNKGGLLVRFAGPRTAAADLGQLTEDPLLPVRLRAGGRSIGGAMSWGEPKKLAPFPAASPFFGLKVPDDVTVSTQVMAQPDPTLAQRVIAQLADGTPLVTRKDQGNGQVVLFHVTANAQWSTLPLSGLFVQMLERLAISTRTTPPKAEDLAGTTWQPDKVLDAYGTLHDAADLPGVKGEVLAAAVPGPALPPGLYAGDKRRLAVNTIAEDTTLAPAEWPARIPVEGLQQAREVVLKGWVLGAALLLLLIDIIASLAIGGRLRGPRAHVAVVLLAGLLALPHPAQAQQNGAVPTEASDAFAIRATTSVVLAHVLTGDATVDDTAQAGLYGLSVTLANRSSVEPGLPIGINIETDELAFFPLLYWPITAGEAMPSRAAYAKLNRYLHSGGMILFDTRDGDIAGFGGATPEGRRLQAIAAGLDIPPLAPIPPDHVLTRTFYLLQDFPGRYDNPDVWAEAAPPDAAQAQGMPFRELNDGVTPVVIGGNDWAAAWAMGQNGQFLYPVGRGQAGDRQREIALRFGVNLVMNALTGNYKSDQVHVPALLERLGQ